MTDDQPLPLPYVFRIERTDGPAPETLSWGTDEEPPGPLLATRDLATYEAARTRIHHRYYGPMTIYVWARRDDEHYRMPTPADAYRLDLTGGTTPQVLRDKIAKRPPTTGQLH